MKEKSFCKISAVQCFKDKCLQDKLSHTLEETTCLFDLTSKLAWQLICSDFQVGMITDFLGFKTGKNKIFIKIKEYWCSMEIFQCIPSRVITHYAKLWISLKYMLQHKMNILLQNSVIYIEVQNLFSLDSLDPLLFLFWTARKHTLAYKFYTYTHMYRNPSKHTDTYMNEYI